MLTLCLEPQSKNTFSGVICQLVLAPRIHLPHASHCTKMHYPNILCPEEPRASWGFANDRLGHRRRTPPAFFHLCFLTHAQAHTFSCEKDTQMHTESHMHTQQLEIGPSLAIQPSIHLFIFSIDSSWESICESWGNMCLRQGECQVNRPPGGKSNKWRGSTEGMRRVTSMRRGQGERRKSHLERPGRPWC